MNGTSVRTAFRRFVGEDQYRRFVRALNTARPGARALRFWQERLWDDFAASTPSIPGTFEQVRGCFGICEIHDRELLNDTVLAPYSQIRYCATQSPDLGLPKGLAGAEDFPYSGWGVSPNDWQPGATRLVEVL